MAYQIHQQDCLAWMATQADDSIDMIIFSPPYNKKGLRGGVKTCENIWRGSNIDYGVYEDNMPESEYQAWQIQIMDECHRVIRPGGSIFYQHKIRNWARRGSHPMSWLSKTQAQFYQEIVWHRRSTMAMDNRYLFNTTERIYWFCKHAPRVFKDQVDAEYRTDVWHIPPERGNKHPAPFPEQLVENCVQLTTQPGDRVYDPFLGSGTTVAVCERLKRDSVGTEIDPDYVTLAQDRLAANTTFGSLFE